MKAKYIIEGANHPTDPEADEVVSLSTISLEVIFCISLELSELFNLVGADTI